MWSAPRKYVFEILLKGEIELTHAVSNEDNFHTPDEEGHSGI